MYRDVFNDDLGELRGVQVKIHVNREPQSKFYWPRPVLYALREGIEEELFRLTKAGIIEPIQYADWAVPIVPVLKENKSQNMWGLLLDGQPSGQIGHLSHSEN